MNVTDYIENFKKLSIHNRLDPFFEADIDSFYDDPSEFSLSLKRSKTELSLYGEKHVQIRQAFFNKLSLNRRRELFVSKINAANIAEWLFETLKINQDDIVDVFDIGKGRSIYKLSLVNKGAYVLKEKTNNNQYIFNQVAEQFNMPAPKSFFTKQQSQFWELTEFLDEHEVFHSKKESLIEIYAQSAAFGDFIELGDRHFENYISRDNDLVAIDVAHLMEQDNEHWTKKYIAGGLYEVCILQYYIHDLTSFELNLKRFFEAYDDHSKQLFNQKETLKSDLKMIKQIENQWVSLNQFIRHMQHIYNGALIEMFDRICHKNLLENLIDKKVELDEYPELKMYYLADQGRISTFFRSEELSGNIFDQIQKLARDHLGVTQQYFIDYKDALNPFKAQLNDYILKKSLTS